MRVKGRSAYARKYPHVVECGSSGLVLVWPRFNILSDSGAIVALQLHALCCMLEYHVSVEKLREIGQTGAASIKDADLDGLSLSLLAA